MATKHKETKSSGLDYRMVDFQGSRQPPGPTPLALAVLKRDGLLRDDEARPVEDHAAGLEPREDAGSEAPTTTSSSRPQPKPRKTSAGERPASARPRAPREAGARPKRAYVLPPAEAPPGPARSVHLRLPPLIELHLKELAEAHQCTRTHVICSAIEAEWSRLRRRRPRSAAGEEPPAT